MLNICKSIGCNNKTKTDLCKKHKDFYIVYNYNYNKTIKNNIKKT